jgi:hypothetical protein
MSFYYYIQPNFAFRYLNNLIQERDTLTLAGIKYSQLFNAIIT